MERYIEGLRDKTCTIMMTSETDRNNVFSSRHDLVEDLSDTVILLRYVSPTELIHQHHFTFRAILPQDCMP